MLLAITHVPSQLIGRCELTYVSREAIDYDLALRQHGAYCRMLGRCGATVRTLGADAAMPDSVFVEDTAIVLDELAVVASMGVASRRAETARIETELRRYREIRRIDPPAMIEGGDVLRLGDTLLVGRSPRTNEEGVRALEGVVRPLGYRVVPVPVDGCLHLKTACTALDDETLLVNPGWLDPQLLAGYRLVEVDQGEPLAANAARVGGHICVAAGHPRTTERIEGMGYDVETVDLGEFAKAEGSVTCLSILLTVRAE